MRRRSCRPSRHHEAVSESYGQSSRFYDALYAAAGKDYEAESADLHQLVQERRPGARTWLDVACGTGAHLVHLATHYQVFGVDLSAAMLAEARARLPGAAFVESDMRSFDLGRQVDVVSCLFSAIAYMPTVADLHAAIMTMGTHVTGGGVLIVDGWIRPSSWRDPGTVQALAATVDATATARVIRSRRDGDRTALELHFLIGTPADGVEYLTEVHHLALFTDEHYRSAIKQAGFDVEVVPSPHPDRDRCIGIRRN
jgi:SAM-dependent methyltransferase